MRTGVIVLINERINITHMHDQQCTISLGCLQVEPASVWLKEEFGAPAPQKIMGLNIQPIIALSGSLKVEGSPRDDSPQSQNQTPQHLAQTLVAPSTTSPAPVFRSVVAHQRPGGQSVSVKVIQARLSFTATGKPAFEKLGQVSYILSVAWAEFGANHTLVTNDGLELHDSAGTQG